MTADYNIAILEFILFVQEREDPWGSDTCGEND